MNRKIAHTKNFVRRHKVAIAVIATAVPLLALNKRNINATNEFLKEHDLYDEYWATEED